ncbi:DUF748 domain-containing protein [Ideonella sp. B7]|uniref:DUF748 domain-containing protein n=1 Tax=Ideonella benzenivorans TaxID=2831643 RepID=UPI001CECB1A9|nr:DUF748 domain-containing protein [Ideonella benzenivorans]MCA6216653.1 DUF748 domain-containing protein [Ideonella benzenivorans]
MSVASAVSSTCLRPGWRRRLTVTLVTLLALAILAALAVPWGLRWAVQTYAPQALGRPVQVQAVRFNPFTLRLRVTGLQVGAAQAGQAPQLTVDELSLALSAASLWQRAPVVRTLVLQSPHLQLARTANGHYDVDDLLKRWQSPASQPASSEPARFALYNLQVLDGRVDFDDRPLAQKHQLSGLQLDLPFISTLSQSDETAEVQPRLRFDLDGSRFDTGARLTPFDPKRPEQVHLHLDQLDLARWTPYLPASLPLRPTEGRLTLELSLGIEQGPQGLGWRVAGQLGLQGLSVQAPAQARALTLQDLQVSLNALAWPQRRLDVKTMSLKGLRVATQRDAQGRWNWQSWAAAPVQVQPPKPSASAAQAAPTAPAWQLALGQLTLEDAQLAVQDGAVRPAGQWTLAVPNLTLHDGRWPLAEAAHPSRLDVRWQLLSGSAAQPVGEAQAQAEISRAAGQVTVKADGWAVNAWQPYLAHWIVPQLEGTLSAQAKLHWQGEPGAQPLQVELPAVTLDHWKVNEGEGRARRTALAWDQLAVQDVALDTGARTVSVGELRWAQPVVQAARDAKGQINLAQWLKRGPAAPAARPGPATRSAADDGAAWHLTLAKTHLEGGRLQWRDETTGTEPVLIKLDGIGLRAGSLQWPAGKGAALPLQGELRWLAAGRAQKLGTLRWDGQVGLAPWGWKGRVRADQLPLSTAAAYLDGGWPVSVDHAVASARLQTRAQWKPTGLALGIQGEARMNDFRLNSRLGGGNATASEADELLSWQALGLQGLDLRLTPGQAPHVEVGQVRLSDFFARLVVTEQGHLNLNDLAARRAAGLAPPEGATAAPVVVAAAPASAVAVRPGASAAAGGSASVDTGSSAQIIVGGVELTRGRVDFEDHFIRPNYRADLTELNGHIGAFRSDATQMATVQLSGRAAGTAQLEIQGEVNPLARPLALNLNARASDLELAPLSPYAGKYAGYAIERGKLTMDVGYRIDPDGKLDARNRIVLNQLTFGEHIDSPDATKLPVLLAVALLKDRNGVIDLDLPISGSINDPQFSVGGLIVKVIVNLLVKAVTAPFALLTGGGGPDLSQVAFVPGTATLVTGSDAALDKVAKALQDRPGLRMTVTGTADLAAEHDAVQAAWVQERVLAEQRRRALREGEAPDAVLPALTPAQREALVRQLYADTKLPGKPRNLIGLAKDIPVAQMEALLRKAAPVNDDVVRQLALARGIAVRDALLARGLPSERLFLAAPRAHAPAAPASGGDSASAWKPSAELSLATR